jgi:hypothetical protein
MSDGRGLPKIIAAIVIGNLVILTMVFLTPRMQFLMAQSDLTARQVMETEGSPDMPNHLSMTYKVANRIGDLTPADARVFMPPGDRLEGSFRSATIQVLYPRRIIFGEDKNFEGDLKQGGEPMYFVYSPDWRPDFCKAPSQIELTDFGFGMCRIDE